MPVESLVDSKVWADYNAAQLSRPVRPLCLAVMKLAGPGNGRQAVDLGCGAGIETGALLRDGWRVHAVDSLADEPTRVAAAVPAPLAANLSVEVSPFERLRTLPPADLCLASYSLPFLNPSAFRDFWQLIRTALLPGGFLAVNLFGDRDSWAGIPDWNFHTEADARELFAGLQILAFEVYDADGQSFRGPKHWHIFDVIARRP